MRLLAFWLTVVLLLGEFGTLAEPSMTEHLMKNVGAIYSTSGAFAALCTDGDDTLVVVWGS